MKKIVLGMILIGSAGLMAFEPPQSKGDKDKNRVSANSSSSSGSGSTGESGMTTIELHRRGSPTLDTARLQQQGKIVISNAGDLLKLEEALQRQGVQLGSRVGERRSIIYLPQLDLAVVARDMSGGSANKPHVMDVEKGSSEELDNQAMEQAFNFFVNYMKEKSENPDLDLRYIKKDLIKKFKKAHNTPPPTPNDNPKIARRQQTKQGVEALRKASYVQQTARTKRAELPKTPISNRTREPKPLEIVESLLNDPAMQEGIQSLEKMVINLLAERNQQTQTSLNNTRYGGIIGALASAGLTALVTYLGTKKNC